MGLRSLLPLAMGLHCVLFEPNVELREFTTELFALNGFHDFELDNVCLADHVGTAKFYVSVNPYMSSLDDNWAADQGASREIDVPLTTLDNWMSDRPDLVRRPALLKIDVEGAEAQVLQGARRYIEERQPPIICEVGMNADKREQIWDYCLLLRYAIQPVRAALAGLAQPLDRATFVELSSNPIFCSRRGRHKLPSVMSVEQRHDVCFVVSCHAGTEKYIPMVRSLLAAFWPEHPASCFVTDGATQPAEDVWSFPAKAWVELLQAGLARIAQERPQTKYVLHMLEDHCPLRRCDARRLAHIFAIAAREDFAAASFPTYAWPWHETDPTEHPDGLIRTWRRKETREFDGELFAAVPRDFFRYFQVQPTLWRLDYLQAACANALAKRIGDAWASRRCAGQGPSNTTSRATAGQPFITASSRKEKSMRRLSPIGSQARPRIASHPCPRHDWDRSPMLFDLIQMLISAKRVLPRTLARVKKRMTASRR